MFRFAFLVLVALGLSSCGEQGTSNNALQGKWGWFNLRACEANRDVIEFSGTSFTQWALRRNEETGETPQSGVVVRQGRDTVYQINEAGWITVTYILDHPNGTAQTVSLTFEPSVAERRNPEGELVRTYNVLLFRGSVIDGSVPERTASVIGRPLFNCAEVLSDN